MAPKAALYDVRFVTGDGPDGYFARLTPSEFEELKEVLTAYSQTGEIAEVEISLLDESRSLTFVQLKSELGERFGILEKGHPDASRVDVRLDEETEQQIRDLLTSAFEGGVGYWARIDGKKLPPGTKMEDFKKGGRMQPRRPDGSENYHHWSQLIPTIPGGQLVIREVSDGEEGETSVLDLPALRRGWMLLKQQHPKRYERALQGDADAEDGDVFLQLSLFGKVIFG